jgi:hypothetical protein
MMVTGFEPLDPDAGLDAAAVSGFLIRGVATDFGARAGATGWDAGAGAAAGLGAGVGATDLAAGAGGLAVFVVFFFRLWCFPGR